MKLVPEWRRVVALSLSFWMQIFGVLVMIGPELRYAFTGQDYDPYVAWWVGIGLLVAGIIGRFWQQNLSLWQEWLRIVGIAIVIIALAFLFAAQSAGAAQAAPVYKSPASEQETLDIAMPFILSKEGVRLKAYLDIVGVPTICGGLTSAAGIKVYIGMPDMKRDECMRLMRIKIAEYRNGIHAYFTASTINTRLPAPRDTAYTSLAYNAGIPTIGKSTAVRRLNAGDIAGGCTAIGWYDKAGGRVVRGLFLRRADEIDLCMKGV